MEGKCKKIIEKLNNMYNIEVIYNEAMPTNKPSNFLIFFNNLKTLEWEDISFYIRNKGANEDIGYTRVIRHIDYLYISMFTRISSEVKYKGVMTKVLYSIICIAISLKIPIKFEATSEVGISHGYKKLNAEKLYNYYNRVGFIQNSSRPRTRSHSRLSSRKYNTRPNNLERIINNLNNNNTSCIGWFCGTRKRSKQPPPA